MHDYRTTHAWNALTQNQNRRATRGDGVLEGCQVTAGTSSSSVESEHDGGYVILDGQVCDLGQNAVTHSNGDPDLPRRDVVIAERTGDNTAAARAIEGTPGEWATVDGQEYRYAEAWEPHPDDTAGVDGAVLAIVTVGPGATQSSGILDVEDRRREPAPRERQPWQQATLEMETTNLDVGDFYAKPFSVPGDTWIHVWWIGQQRFLDGNRAAWDTTTNSWRLAFMEPVEGGTDNSLSSTAQEYASGDFRNGVPLWQFEVGGNPNEIYPYWIRLYNNGGTMSAEEYWGARGAVTVDERPLG